MILIPGGHRVVRKVIRPPLWTAPPMERHSPTPEGELAPALRREFEREVIALMRRQRDDSAAIIGLLCDMVRSLAELSDQLRASTKWQSPGDTGIYPSPE